MRRRLSVKGNIQCYIVIMLIMFYLPSTAQASISAIYRTDTHTISQIYAAGGFMPWRSVANDGILTWLIMLRATLFTIVLRHSFPRQSELKVQSERWVNLRSLMVNWLSLMIIGPIFMK